MGLLQLRLLGGFEARLATGEGIELRSQRAQAILAYLAVQPGRETAQEPKLKQSHSPKIDPC